MSRTENWTRTRGTHSSFCYRLVPAQTTHKRESLASKYAQYLSMTKTSVRQNALSEWVISERDCVNGALCLLQKWYQSYGRRVIVAYIYISCDHCGCGVTLGLFDLRNTARAWKSTRISRVLGTALVVRFHKSRGRQVTACEPHPASRPILSF